MLDAGLHYDVPMDDYIRDPAPEPSLSKGGILSLVTKSPKHAWQDHPRLNPDWKDSESSRADLGSAVHAMILGGKKLAVCHANDWRMKENQTFRDAARAKGLIPILAHQEKEISKSAVAAQVALQTLPGWTDDIQTEGTMIWMHDSAWRRGRFDIFSKSANMLIDIKTTASADPGAWIRTSLRAGGYDVQAEHYLQGARKLGIADEYTDFLFLLVEIEPPYCCSFVGLDPAYTDLAKRRIKLATKIWLECLDSGKWPGYPVIPHWAEAPAWMENELSERKMITEAKEQQAKGERNDLFIQAGQA